jgi:HJR/Mrr/RecB family endonuclease
MSKQVLETDGFLISFSETMLIDEILKSKMLKNKTNMLDNQLIFKFKQFDSFFIAKVFSGLIWKARWLAVDN